MSGLVLERGDRDVGGAVRRIWNGGWGGYLGFFFFLPFHIVGDAGLV